MEATTTTEASVSPTGRVWASQFCPNKKRAAVFAASLRAIGATRISVTKRDGNIYRVRGCVSFRQWRDLFGRLPQKKRRKKNTVKAS